MNKRRLLKLASFLETSVPSKKFNMEYWGTSARNNYGCGTTACALGWAGYIPSFKRAGLHTTPDEFGGDVNFNKDGVNFHNFSAGREFFGLTDAESYHLFAPSNYPQNKRGPKSVAKRIRKLVKDGALIE